MKAIPGTTLLMKNRAIIATHSGGSAAGSGLADTHEYNDQSQQQQPPPAHLRLHLMSQSKRKEFSFC